MCSFAPYSYWFIASGQGVHCHHSGSCSVSYECLQTYGQSRYCSCLPAVEGRCWEAVAGQSVLVVKLWCSTLKMLIITTLLAPCDCQRPRSHSSHLTCSSKWPREIGCRPPCNIYESLDFLEATYEVLCGKKSAQGKVCATPALSLFIHRNGIS